MGDFLQHDLTVDITPVKDTKPGDETCFVPTALVDSLFGKADRQGHPIHVYGVIDAAKVQFLPERLLQSNLPHMCLYTNQDYAESAPWLVQLTGNAELTRHFFAHDPDQDNPWHMLSVGAGILLRSTFDLRHVQAHLRHYTLLPDEEGIRQFFRFQEPGFLDAVLKCSDQAEISSFFARIENVLYLFPALKDGLWNAVSISAHPGLHRSHDEPYKLPIIDKDRRRALQEVLSARQGRAMAIHSQAEIQERKMRAEVYTRLINAGFDNETTLIETYDLLAQIPNNAHESIWQAIESGDHSLGFLNYKIAKHYNIEMEIA